REHAEPNWQPVTVNKICDIGAEQHELAMGEIEDAHHARDNAEPQDHEDDDGPESQNFEGGVQHAFHAVSPAGKIGLRTEDRPQWSARLHRRAAYTVSNCRA